ncbi:MAG: 3-phosphoshikimate 1-carboxyvinyltransferase [Deltaproteobacteria bacterium]|nr:3-phosphoshikimate 1-carboxyvinyltransferase [Deltaproteobacteria bacterium]
MIEIQSRPIQNTTVTVPGSKSYTHRALIISALSDGECEIINGLDSEDTRLTRDALRQLGVFIDQGPASWRVRGTHGMLQACGNPIFLGNSGTSMRLLAAVCALGIGKYILTGTPRMQERPIQDLLEGLNQIGVGTKSLGRPGCPPIEIEAGEISGGRVSLNCGTSSQYLSALLLISPFTRNGMEITVTEGPVSKPYIDMTIDIMNQAGVSVARNGYQRFQIAGNQGYRSGRFRVEPDLSQAGYFWAAAAVTGKTITVDGVPHASRQGDLRLLDVLSSMGCTTRVEPDGISVTGGKLKAVEVDMGAMPDMVPTLAVVAAFAKGRTVITNVGHLKAKESDRLGSVVAELLKLGIAAGCSDTAMWIDGGTPHAALIDPHNDHRLAMSFAVAGLKTPGIRIENETCVEKSFPEFWKVFESLYP